MSNNALLERMAAKYIWWKSTADAIQLPNRVIAQVMDIGDYDDVLTLTQQLGEDALKEVLTHAEAGQFSARSWAYWHYRLGMARIDQVPSMPVRVIP